MQTLICRWYSQVELWESLQQNFSLTIQIGLNHKTYFTQLLEVTLFGQCSHSVSTNIHYILKALSMAFCIWCWCIFLFWVLESLKKAHKGTRLLHYPDLKTLNTSISQVIYLPTGQNLKMCLYVLKASHPQSPFLLSPQCDKCEWSEKTETV